MNTTPNNDGGHAFPAYINTPSGLVADALKPGMSLRVWLAAHAPAAEIEGVVGDSVELVAEFLGIKSADYNYRIHYHAAVAKARYAWADAMLAARNQSQEQPASDPEQEPTPIPTIAANFPPLPKGIAAPPEGFAFVSEGPLKVPADEETCDVVWCGESGWVTGYPWKGVAFGPWAVRIGSDIAKANGIGISPEQAAAEHLHEHAAQLRDDQLDRKAQQRDQEREAQP